MAACSKPFTWVDNSSKSSRPVTDNIFFASMAETFTVPSSLSHITILHGNNNPISGSSVNACYF